MIKTYLPEKQYGFIRGDDDKDYFFHTNAFSNSHANAARLHEGDYIEFYQQATPKGYKAINCTLISPTDIDTYKTPDKFLVSKSNKIFGWHTIQYGHWLVQGTSKESPEAAKLDAVRKAKQVGANGLIDLEYYYTTGQEAGFGRGTHYYTIHHFCGRVVNIANPHSKGKCSRSELTGLNQNAEKVKESLVEQTSKSRKKAFIVWLIVLVMSMLIFDYVVIFVLLGLIFGRPARHDDWLERP